MFGAFHHGRFGFAALLESTCAGNLVITVRIASNCESARSPRRMAWAARSSFGANISPVNAMPGQNARARCTRRLASVGKSNNWSSNSCWMFVACSFSYASVLNRLHDIQHPRRGLAILPLGVTQHRGQHIRVFFRPWVTDWCGGGGRSGHGSNNTGHTDKTTPPNTSVDNHFRRCK
ncbi:hypothetical protein [Fodinicola acaciae]|uniref:hypothetical protein n=1 Tax=Fodinicola acaciae TaxID=2681555 RepID=UPI0013D2E903|nr:hypothetical protein [Fodinicola acaciae]